MEMLRIDPWLLGEKQLYPKFVFKVLEKKLKKNRSSQKNLDQGFLSNEIDFDVQPFFLFQHLNSFASAAAARFKKNFRQTHSLLYLNK